MFDVMFIFDEEVVDVDMLWIWCINIWKPNIVWLHDLTILSMHDSIIIDKLMSWMMMIEVASLSERETLHEISTPIINCKKWIEDTSLLKEGL